MCKQADGLWINIGRDCSMVDIKRKNIIIRADGNAQIGAGHLMRCLTIAEALKNKSLVGFVCADKDSAQMVLAKGFDAYVLGTDYCDMESELPLWVQLFGDKADKFQGTTSGEEAALTNRVFLVDSYYVTNTYLEGLAVYGQVVILDDMAKQPWNVARLINYNVFAKEEMYQALKSPYHTEYYLGGRYVPIRKDFCGKEYPVKEQARDVLITTGGGDVENIAGQILDKIWDEKCIYHVVTGRFNPHFEALQTYAKKKRNVYVYHDVKDMADLMAKCDVAVTAGGTTVYELSTIGVPFVCFSYAENQEKLTEYIGSGKIAGYGGAYHKDREATLSGIAAQVEELIKKKELREEYSEKERQLIDGCGAGRIADVLQNLVN